MKDKRDYSIKISAWVDCPEDDDYYIKSETLSGAVCKAIKMFRKKFRYKHISEMKIKVVKTK